MATYNDGLTPTQGSAIERLNYWLSLNPRATFHALGMAKVDCECRADRLRLLSSAGDRELGEGAALAARAIDVLRELVPQW
jgi:hypothetical protein